MNDVAVRGVTIVTPGFRPLIGGVEAHTSALASELIRRGIPVRVLTSRRDVDRTTIVDEDGCQVVTYPAWRVSSMSISPRLLLGAIRRRSAGGVMHVHSYHATTAISMLGRRTPTVFTPHYHGRHGHSPVANLLHGAYYQLAKILLRRCDAIICVSEAESEQLREDFPFVAGRVSVIPNGVATEGIRNAEPFVGQPPTVITVGRLEPYKRFDVVIAAFGAVSAPAQLVVIGAGSQREKLESLVTQLGIGDRVRFEGAVSDDVMHRWLRTAAVSVSVSEREAFGMAPLEAATAGARVVLSDIPAHQEIVNRYLGAVAVLLPDVSPDALAAEITRQLATTTTTQPYIPDWTGVAGVTAELYAAITGHKRTWTAFENRSAQRLCK